MRAKAPSGGRYRRQTDTSPQTYELELAIYVDAAMVEIFAQRYSFDEAHAVLREFVETIIDTAELMWRLDSITPKLQLKIVKVPK